jgi:hypothetical protein
VVYNDVGTAPGDKADIYFRQSRDGGATWGRQIKVNDDKTMNDQWQPGLAVTPDGTRVGVFWYDRRGDPGNNLIDRFGSIATLNNGGVSFGPNIRVTTRSFAPTFGVDPLVASNYMGDYDQVAADNQFFYTTWGDNSLPSQGHVGFNADVRFAKIPVSTNPPAVQSVMAALGTAGAGFAGASANRPLSIDETQSATPGPVHNLTHNTTLTSISVKTASFGPSSSGYRARRLPTANSSAENVLSSAALDDFFTDPVSFFP